MDGPVQVINILMWFQNSGFGSKSVKEKDLRRCDCTEFLFRALEMQRPSFKSVYQMLNFRETNFGDEASCITSHFWIYQNWAFIWRSLLCISTISLVLQNWLPEYSCWLENLFLESLPVGLFRKSWIGVTADMLLDQNALWLLFYLIFYSSLWSS